MTRFTTSTTPAASTAVRAGTAVQRRPVAVPSQIPAPKPARNRRGGWALAALLGGMFLGNVDIAIANIAAPSIHAGLNASGGELELVVSGYTLAYALLLITSARLGDIRGYRRMYLAGLALFTLASAACALAPDAAFLVAARIVQGGAAALMASQVLTGIQLSFEGAARSRALGLYTVVLSAGAVAGQSLGGLLISADLFGAAWRPAFGVNVPAGIVLMGVAWRFLPRSEGPRRQRLDLAGVAALSAALLLLVVPLVLGRDEGWPVWTWASLACSVPAFAAFAAVERRVAARGGYPLVNLHLLRRPAISWGLISQAADGATYFALLFVLALYLQQGLGKSPAYSGLALVSWVAAFGVPGLVLGRLSARPRNAAAWIGSVLLAAGFAGMGACLLAGATSGALLMALLGVGGLGLGAAISGMLSHLTAVDARYAADISGLFNTTMRAGGVIGVAIFGTVYLSLVPAPGRIAIHGFAIVTLALAVTALAAAVAGRVSVASRRGSR